ncbi:protein enabled homolog [Phymastichus coffea]|uniref:protein enabled homolog n=1 Tax=Phymastichus coffea TaxID=108790 RepID=UPI00273AF36A|nr:protein enabled homolog [Phymastichus coffea]
MAPRILVAKKKGLSLTVKIPLSTVPRTITGIRKRETRPARAPEPDRHEESLGLQALTTMPGYQEREKARLEAMEVAEEEPPQPLPVGQERDRLHRWALTFQTRIPEADWRREERRRMEVVRAIREEMNATADQMDGRTAETLSERGTSKSHCSDTSKGSQLSLDGQAEKELEDYLDRGAESGQQNRSPPPSPPPPPSRPSDHQPPPPPSQPPPPTDHRPLPSRPPPPIDHRPPPPSHHHPPPPPSRRPQGAEVIQADYL